MTGTIIARTLHEHLISKGRPDERRQKLVENNPLIVPPQLPGGLVEYATFGYSSPSSVIDKRIVSFQHGEVQLRDQHVRIVARVTDDRGALYVPLYVSSDLANQELRWVVALVEEWMAGWSVTVQRFKVEFRTAGVV
jgi:hypothetical protein